MITSNTELLTDYLIPHLCKPSSWHICDQNTWHGTRSSHVSSDMILLAAASHVSSAPVTATSSWSGAAA